MNVRTPLLISSWVVLLSVSMNDDQLPATKGDLKVLQQSMHGDLESHKLSMQDALESHKLSMQDALLVHQHSTQRAIQSMGGALRTLQVSMDAKFEKVHEDIDRVLEVLVNIDKRYRGKLENHEKRLVCLEGIAG